MPALLRDVETLNRTGPDDGRAAVTPRRELTRLDTVLFMISAVVVMDTMGAIAIGGAQAFTWLVVLFGLFFVPSALACAELGAAIPQEGGAYVWVRRAFGQSAGSLTSFLYWAGVPMWIGGSVAVVAMSVYERFIAELSMTGLLVFGCLFVAAATAGAMLPLRLGKWIPASGAIGQIVLLAVLTVSVIWYGIVNGIHGIAWHEFTPTTSVFIMVVPVLLYSFVGVELPATAGEEMRDPRKDLPAAIARAGVVQGLLYGIPVLAVLLVLPADQITSLRGLIDAMGTAFTVFGGSVAADGTATLTGAGQLAGWASAAMFIWVLMASGSVWIMGAGRAQAAACMDGGGPRWFGQLSPRTCAPLRMAVASGALSLLTVVVSLSVTGGDGDRYFSVALTISIALVVLAYLLIFPAFVMLRYREPDLDRPFLAPGGLACAWLITILTTGWSLLTAICVLWPGLGTAHPDRSLPAGFHGARGEFEVLVLLPLLVLVAIAVAYDVAGRARRPGAAGHQPQIRLTQTASTESIEPSYPRVEGLPGDAATAAVALD